MSKISRFSQTLRSQSKKLTDSMSAFPGTEVLLARLSLPDLLNWSKTFTQGKANIYDKAMDEGLLRPKAGGNNHRMFDGGHDLFGAWEKVQNASKDDTFLQEVISYFSSLWKDLTTERGLPFATIESESYSEWAENASRWVPGVDKSYFYDLLSFDAFELVNSAIGVVALIFAFKKKDKERFAELVGALGIVSVASANPVAAILMISIAAYAYTKKKVEFDGAATARGAAMATGSLLIFSTLGLPLLIELVLAMVVASLIRKFKFGKKDVESLIRRCHDRVTLKLGQRRSG